MKYKSFILCLLLAFIVVSSAQGQIVELGAHFGYNITRLSVKENRLNDQVFVKSGKPFGGVTIGGQYMMGPPKKQSKSGFVIIPSIMLEASLCRCGGNIELSLTNPDGTRTFNELRYLFYRADYSAKVVGKMKRFQVLAGPTISHRFYTGVRIGASDNLRFAGDHFKTFAIGYEFGIAKQIKNVTFSARYNGLFGPYGKESLLVPTAYRNFQLRFMVHYFFLRKHRGLNWDSIYWE